jgi:Protein of unknown function (DUF2946)
VDEIVRKALAKWPNVPHCTGWLLLDRRGQWRMRDDAAQAAGALGDIIRHEALLGFINRNYAVDDEGQWFFQNGPQRVYVELAYTPWIVRLLSIDGELQLTDHAGAAFEPTGAWLDDEGGVLFSDSSIPPRVAALHDHDLEVFADHASQDEGGGTSKRGIFHWRIGANLLIGTIPRGGVEQRFGFVASPAARAAGQ